MICAKDELHLVLCTRRPDCRSRLHRWHTIMARAVKRRSYFAPAPFRRAVQFGFTSFCKNKASDEVKTLALLRTRSSLRGSLGSLDPTYYR